MSSALERLHNVLASRRRLALTLLFPFLLGGCTGYPSVLAPASPEAGEVASLFWGVMAVAAVIFVVVEGLLVIALLRFRNRANAPEPDQIHGHLRLEIAWTLVPSLVVVGLFVATLQTMGAVTEPKRDALQVKVVGYQWWWKVEYPDLGITTAADIHVPVGQPVAIELVAGDVIHSFWAPELFGKTDVVPGHSTSTRFTASRAGVFRGQCAEFCGVQHANMGFLIIAEPRDQFDDWVRRMQSPAAEPTGDETGRGAQAFGSCMGCHTVAGTQAQGKIGPDLTHFGSRRSIAALTLDNNPENLAKWLANPQGVKPGNRMPSLGLSHEAIEDLVAYLEQLE